FGRADCHIVTRRHPASARRCSPCVGALRGPGGAPKSAARAAAEAGRRPMTVASNSRNGAGRPLAACGKRDLAQPGRLSGRGFLGIPDARWRRIFASLSPARREELRAEAIEVLRDLAATAKDAWVANKAKAMLRKLTASVKG